jgi:hypothetical protein
VRVLTLASPTPKACCIPENPRGGREQESYDPCQPAISIPRKVVKGGSHLCAPNYCRRAPRPAGRHLDQPCRIPMRRQTGEHVMKTNQNRREQAMSNDATGIDGSPRSDSGQSPNAHGLSRRNLLLSGTTLAAASALASAAPVRSALAQAQPAAPAGERPTILVIFGDDIGLSSAYSHGLMGLRDAEHRPHRPRRHDVHRLLRRAELHGRTIVLHHRPGEAPASPRLACRE